MASSAPARPPVRLSQIAGRYLVFDLEDVMYLRRKHSICAVFTGTIPQAPSQNVFLSLPVELYAEEAKLLVDKKAAYVVDDPAAQLSQLRTMDETKRKAYIQSLKTQRKNATLVLEQEVKEKAAQSLEAKNRNGKRASRQRTGSTRASESAQSTVAISSEVTSTADEESLFGTAPAPKKAVQAPPKPVVLSITPGTSAEFLDPATNQVEIAVPKSYPLYAHLNSKGFFVTPGLRFGADYSVYPGDPFRYHAHFMANSYGWEEEVPLLEIIALGRLATRVKKSFMMGGHIPSGDKDSASADQPKNESGPGSEARTFCLEWAAM